MRDLLKIIEENLISIKPILNNDGTVRRWVASYRYVYKNTGQNIDMLIPNVISAPFAQGDTPAEAIEELLKWKRRGPVIK